MLSVNGRLLRRIYVPLQTPGRICNAAKHIATVRRQLSNPAAADATSDQPKKSPDVVTAYQSSLQYMFRYSGGYPDTKLHNQWKHQIQIDHYSLLHFEQHLESSPVSSIYVDEPYAKGGDYWKLAFLGYKLKLPITLQLSSNENNWNVHLTRCSVNYFSNGVGIAEMNFEWPLTIPKLTVQEVKPETSESQSKEQQKTKPEADEECHRTTVQSLLEVQRIFLDDAECKIIKTRFEKDTKGDSHAPKSPRNERKSISISTKVSDLFYAVISKNVDENPYILDWDNIDNISPYFLYSQILVEPTPKEPAEGSVLHPPAKVNDVSPHGQLIPKPGSQEILRDQTLPATSAPHEVFLVQKAQVCDTVQGSSAKKPAANHTWTHRQLAFWTYLFVSCATNDQIEVTDDFLANFLSKSCYMRWASETGGLWVGFTSHGGAAVLFGETKEDIERLKKRKQSHNPELISQLIKPLLYQRAYLQVEINHVRNLISRTADAKTLQNHTQVLDELKKLEGNLLRFNLIFCDEISESTAAKAIFEIWQEKAAVAKLKKNLANHVQDLSNFYTGISAEAQKAKLDLLTVIISCLGVAQVLIQMESVHNTFLASGITAISVGSALMWYDKVLKNSADPSYSRHLLNTKMTRKSKVRKKITYADIVPQSISAPPFSTSILRHISVLLLLIGTTSLFCGMREQYQPFFADVLKLSKDTLSFTHSGFDGTDVAPSNDEPLLYDNSKQNYDENAD